MRSVAVAATGPVAVDAALGAVRAGGNAVDAALAAMTVAMTTEPGIVSPMGGAYVTIWPADGEPEVIDGNVEMPGRGLDPERFGNGLLEFGLTYGGGITVYAGPGSVATPGAWAALGLAHERHGSGEWSRVLHDAIKAARNGFHLGRAAASYLLLTMDNIFGWDEQTHAALTGPRGELLAAGDRLVSPDLADSLSLIAERGWREAYTGELGRAIAADQAERGGLITEADLAAYEAVVRTPLRLTAGDWEIVTNPPPSVGGPMLAVMLGQLAARGGTDWRDVIEVQKHVLTYRTDVHDFSANLEDDGYRMLDEVRRKGLAGLTTSASTAHVSAVDSDGTACAITASSGYGSGATVPGTGLMLNNCLGEPELNRLGLHALPPGTRLASNMAPSAGRAKDGRVLAIGTPGADRITTALMQVLARHCVMGVDIGESIGRSRAHVRVVRGEATRVDFEQDAEIAAAVDALGMPGREHDPHSMYFGGVGAATRSASGVLSAAGDPRREAATGVA
ncbi:MAG: gamma-glutamyltransferase [Actinomycetia bacterium]|nr:gamma-glutamyltransferase [Actinomycetes bacterium]